MKRAHPGELFRVALFRVALFRVVLLCVVLLGATLPVSARYPVSDDRVTSSRASRHSVHVSDDGRRIVYAHGYLGAPYTWTGRTDVRLFDRADRVERIISLNADGTNSKAALPTAMSGDGLHVAIRSWSRLTNDAPVDPDGSGVYVYDVEPRTIRYIGSAADMRNGIESLSGDGSIAAARTRSYEPMILNLLTGAITYLQQIELTTHETYGPRISADGSTLVFTADSAAADPPDANGLPDVYAYNLRAGTVSLVSVGTAGRAGDDGSFDAVVSGDGRSVAFLSYAHDIAAGPSCVPVDPPSDLRCRGQVFVRDLLEGKTETVSVSSGGVPSEEQSGPPLISSDGRYVVFSTASQIIDPFNALPAASSERPYVRDRARGTTLRMFSLAQQAEPFFHVWSYAFSGDGRTLAYAASTLLDGDTFNVYVTGNPGEL